jgi:hypothetical protein
MLRDSREVETYDILRGELVRLHHGLGGQLITTAMGGLRSGRRSRRGEYVRKLAVSISHLLKRIVMLEKKIQLLLA